MSGRPAKRRTTARRSPRSGAREVAANLHFQSSRLKILGIALVLAASGLGYRLANLQIAQHAQLASEALQNTPSSHPALLRGMIYDDTGNPLALGDDVYQVFAAPVQIIHPVIEARLLAPIVGVKLGPLIRTLRGQANWVKIGVPIPQSRANTVQHLINNLSLIGISLVSQPQRVYPEGRLGAQVLGFTNTHGGQYGVEQQYNGLLSGLAPSSRVTEMAQGDHAVVQATGAGLADEALQNGASLHLSIDSYMQDVAQQELSQTVLHYEAQGGTVIVMNPWTGRVLALANYPSFNPNHWTTSPTADWSDPAISAPYEPGSTFKIVTMAAGINTQVITPRTTIYDPGYANYPAAHIVVHNWDYPVSNGRETMIQVLQHSANVGAAHVANLLGTRRFYRYLRAFGVGSSTGVDLQGEVAGTLPLPGVPYSTWSLANLYTNAYGQGLTVTALQLLTAVNAVANGGFLMRPEIVTKINYRGMTLSVPPHRIRRVISRRSASTVTNMLVRSARNGEASEALVPGYTIAAKTGTASIAGGQGIGYISGPGSTNASTVGYTPAHHPRFSVLVLIRRPRLVPWGSLVAAPVVHDMFQALFLRYHIPPATSVATPMRGSW